MQKAEHEQKFGGGVQITSSYPKESKWKKFKTNFHIL